MAHRKDPVYINRLLTNPTKYSKEVDALVRKANLEYPELAKFYQSRYNEIINERRNEELGIDNRNQHQLPAGYYHTYEKLLHEYLLNLKYIRRYGVRSVVMVVNPHYKWVKGNTVITLDYVHNKTGKFIDNSAWAHRHTHAEMKPNHVWDYFNQAFLTVGEIRVVLDMKDIEYIKHNWFDKTDPNTGKTIAYGYHNYAKLGSFAKENNIPLSLYAMKYGKVVRIVRMKTSFKDCVVFEETNWIKTFQLEGSYKRNTPVIEDGYKIGENSIRKYYEYTKTKLVPTWHSAWYDMAKAGYPVILKVNNSKEIGKIKFRAQKQGIEELITLAIPADTIFSSREVYHYYKLSELDEVDYVYTNKEGEEKEYNIQYDATAHLDGKYEWSNNIISRTDRYIGTMDKTYNANMRGRMKALATGKWEPLAPTHKLDDEADALIKEYLDIEFHDAPDLNVAYHTILNYRFTPENPKVKVETDKDGKIQLPKSVMIDFIKEKPHFSVDDKNIITSHYGDEDDGGALALNASSPWNDDDATSLGIQWAKRYKTKDAFGLTTTFEDEDYLMSFTDNRRTHGLPSQSDVDAYIDAMKLKEDIKRYAEMKASGETAKLWEQTKAEFKKISFAERRKRRKAKTYNPEVVAGVKVKINSTVKRVK